MSLSKKQIFDRETAGRLPQTLTSDFAEIIAPLQADLKYSISQLRQRGATVFKNIYIDVVDDLSLNALAFIYEGHEFVGINAGVGISIPLIYFSMLSQPWSFATIGNASSEEQQPISIDKLLFASGKASAIGAATNLNSYVSSPQDPVRFHYGATLGMRAWHFLLFHEIGHIARGHLPYLHERGFMPEVSSQTLKLMEFDGGVSNQTRKVLRVLESDADSIAARIQVEGLLSQTPAEHAMLALGDNHDTKPNWSWDDVAYTWLVSVGLLFHILSILDRSPILKAGRTHPHPDVRFFILTNFAWSSWQKVIPNIENYRSIVRKARQDILGVWVKLGLPSPFPTNLNYTKDFWKAVNTFRSGFDGLASRLNELSLNRIGSTDMAT
jgi:hypothetical protein